MPRSASATGVASIYYVPAVTHTVVIISTCDGFITAYGNDDHGISINGMRMSVSVHLMTSTWR